MREAKRDCFAYHNFCGTEVCSALKAMYCKYGKGECKFYKTKENFCGKCPSKKNNKLECMKCKKVLKGEGVYK